MKQEPEWMRTFRHKSLDYFLRRPMPQWGGDLNQIDFDNIFYFLRATEKQATSWDELPADIKTTYDRLGIPEAEKQRLIAGVAAQYESEVVYHKVREDLEEQGVLFLDTDTALKEHEDVPPALGHRHPPNDNKFAALAVVGRVVHLIPEGVHVEIPLQAYFRINSQNMGRLSGTGSSLELRLQRALCRGLHRSHLLLGLAALGGGRDHRQAARQGPLHHHPELVDQRLQPGHQAGRGL